jgi:hypothetical protein
LYSERLLLVDHDRREILVDPRRLATHGNAEPPRVAAGSV